MTNYEQFEKGHSGLFETQITDLFPLDSPQICCLSYAVHRSMEMIKKYSERICLRSNIAQLPSDILDYLAREMALPYYDSEFDIETKRRLIEEGYTWHYRAGTVEGVESLICAIFGNGSIVEWFDFDEGERIPGYFDVIVNGSAISDDSVERFNKILKNSKNVSRWLRKVSANCDTGQKVYIVHDVSLTDELVIC